MESIPGKQGGLHGQRLEGAERRHSEGDWDAPHLLGTAWLLLSQPCDSQTSVTLTIAWAAC